MTTYFHSRSDWWCGGGVLVAKLCLTLCDHMDYRSPNSSVYGISQARILEWAAISFSRGSSQPRDQTYVSCISGRFITDRATREAKELTTSFVPEATVAFLMSLFTFQLLDLEYYDKAPQ